MAYRNLQLWFSWLNDRVHLFHNVSKHHLVFDLQSLAQIHDQKKFTYNMLNYTILEYALDYSFTPLFPTMNMHYSAKQILTGWYWLIFESEWRRNAILLSLSWLNCYVLYFEFYYLTSLKNKKNHDRFFFKYPKHDRYGLIKLSKSNSFHHVSGWVSNLTTTRQLPKKNSEYRD